MIWQMVHSAMLFLCFTAFFRNILPIKRPIRYPTPVNINFTNQSILHRFFHQKMIAYPAQSDDFDLRIRLKITA